MNTRLTFTKSLANHIIVLSNDSNLDWADEYLSLGEIDVLAKGVQKEIQHFYFPKSENAIFVQILKEEEKKENELKEIARLAAAKMLDYINTNKVENVTIINHSHQNFALEYAEGLVLANYQFLKYFTEKEKKAHSLVEVQIHDSSSNEREIALLNAALTGTCVARDLVNEPHSYLNAPTFSKETQALGKKYGFKVEVLEKKQIEELKMGGLLAVNMGSFTPPTFNIMEWNPSDAVNKKPIVLVGKGVMFDTGGVSLKPTKNSMDFMKCDMGGSATVLGTMVAISKANLPINVVGLVAATDNRPGNDAYLPGDVITMMSGTTVEVLNTDAEGRMTLADALHYAKRYEPELVMDFATLTGAAAYCVGPEGTCYMGNADSKLKYKLEESGARQHERLIEFPMWKEYGETIKSSVADIKNLGGAYAGHITAGMFLQHFTDYPWLHFDIAGTAYMQSPKGYRTKEGTGVGVRLLFDFFKGYSS